MPENSSLQFEWLAPFKVWYDENAWAQKWDNFGLSTYVELKPGVDPVALNRQLLNPLYDFTTQKNESSTSTVHVFLFGMNDWHLRNDFDNGKETGSGRIQYVHLFTIIAWIILFIACINFMNLATAGSEKRSKEIGVRKVLGAGKKRLVFQFIGEAIFMALIAAVAAVFIMTFLLPAFNLLVQKNLSLGLTNPFSFHRIVVAYINLRPCCRKLSITLPVIIQPCICFKRNKIKNRKCGNYKERFGSNTVRCFDYTYHRHHYYLPADTACKKQGPWI